MKIAKILVEGIVQGVGFRPNVYRIAIELDLKGIVRNLGNVVEIIVKGNENKINEFTTRLKEDIPPIAKINSINVEIFNTDSNFSKSLDLDFQEFKILESSPNFSGDSVIPPDVAICDNCLEEIEDNTNRRYEYPFTSCTDCGPRFTIIKDVPYDRDKTSMDEFPLCEKCMEEYRNPLNRRYHAEANCCDECGPELSLLSKKNKIIASNNPLKDTANLLDDGKILAIKGIGGTHLVASVTNKKAIKTLRKRLNRFNQPFAVMSPNLNAISTFANLLEIEKKSLISKEKPIVVVKKNEDYYFDENVAPQLHNIGVMLPYSPLHNILFRYSDENAYIMTSANLPGEPMLVDNEEILKGLGKIADYFLLHDRKIINRCDDSVIRYRNNNLAFIRRSRGYTPKPYDLSKIKNINKDVNVLALGPELDVTFTIAKKELAYISQHIGNTNKFKTYTFLQEAIEHLMNITKTKDFDAISCDMHPQFFTTGLAKEMGEKFNCDVVPVQHHHAHGAVLAIDNNLDELVYIAADGVGYGDDGTVWGGEILYSDVGTYERLGSLMKQKMPGGDISTKYPVRMLASILSNVYDEEELKELLKKDYKNYFQYRENEIDSLFKQLNSNLNVGITTSTGRILDSISVALGICGKRSYEGECSMKLESFAYGAKGDLAIPYEIKKENNHLVMDTSLLLKNIMEKIKQGESKKEIAAAGQVAISEGLGEIAIQVADKKGVENIGATGGVFYNEAITLATKKYIENAGFKFIQHKESCPGDGSVALGQAIIAKRLKN